MVLWFFTCIYKGVIVDPDSSATGSITSLIITGEPFVETPKFCRNQTPKAKKAHKTRRGCVACLLTKSKLCENQNYSEKCLPPLYAGLHHVAGLESLPMNSIAPLWSSCIRNMKGWSAIKCGGTDVMPSIIAVAAAASVPSSFTSTNA